jgi:signal transduction histidine kinase
MMSHEAPPGGRADRGGEEEQLRREAYASAMAELVAHIAHEVNQPLAAMAANANACMRWLVAQPPNIEEACAASARIVHDARRAADVIGEMRAFLSRTHGPQEVFLLQEVLEEAVEEANRAAERAGILMHLERGDAAPVQLLGRRTALHRALRHLLDNALEACAESSAPRREVRVRLRGPERGEMVIEVEDTGPGFRVDAPQRLFDPLFTTKPGRLGLGLAVSRSAVEEQGGRVLAQRGADGRTRFVVTLPVEASAP